MPNPHTFTGDPVFGFKVDRKLAEIHQNKKISSPKKCKQKRDNRDCLPI